MRRVGGLRNVQLHEAEKCAALINGRHGVVQVNAIAARIYNASVEYPTMFLWLRLEEKSEKSRRKQERRGRGERTLRGLGCSIGGRLRTRRVPHRSGLG